ncbi:MAG: AAA family ATPase [Hyphomicrobiales bacterium]
MFTSVRFQNFKGLSDYSISLRRMNVLVGPNNAGKSSVLDAFRVLAVAIRHARSRNPTLLSLEDDAITGYDLPRTQMPISLVNVHSDYRDELSTNITFRIENGNKLRLTFVDSSRCVLTVENSGPPTRTTTQFRKHFPIEIASFPTLGPFEEEESVLSEEYVQRWQGSRRGHGMFRNIWYHQPERFEEFEHLVSQTWPGMRVLRPERHGYAPPKLMMFCEEHRKTRELYWSGFGFQVWLQILTHLVNAAPNAALVVDEPEIYLHPDLQHRLFYLLRGRNSQVILATHSAEIVNDAEHDEVVMINRSRRSAKRVGDIEGLQDALFSIGSAQNIHLTKLSRGRKILFLEGDDYKLLKRFAIKAGFSNLADDVNLTVVPIGGFGQRQRIEDVAWTFEKVLRAKISIAALLDRDFRCEEEIAKIIGSVTPAISHFHLLGAKEIENYLLIPSAISSAVRERLKERNGPELSLEAASIEAVEATLQKCTAEIRSDVTLQLMTHRMRFFGRTGADASTLMKPALKLLEVNWPDLAKRLRIVPGKQILADLNREFQRDLQVSITPSQIIRAMAVGDIAADFMEVLADLDRFASS